MTKTFRLAVAKVAVAALASASEQDPAGLVKSQEPSAARPQNPTIEERIKLLERRSDAEKQDRDNPLALQNEIIQQRLKLAADERSLAKLASVHDESTRPEIVMQPKDDMPIESIRLAYTSLASVIPDVAKALSCSGNNVVLYGPAHSESLLALQTFRDQVELLRSRLKSVLDIQPPSPPDKEGATRPYGVSTLSAPVLQSVLDMIALFRGVPVQAASPSVEERGLIAMVAGAATAEGCLVFSPERLVPNPIKPSSQVMSQLRELADLNDSAAGPTKQPGLLQRIEALRLEVSRAELMTLARQQAIDALEETLAQASKRVDAIKSEINFTAGHIKDQKNAALQDKLNKAFDKSWDELDQAVRRQLSSHLPGTIEEQGKLGEMSKRLDLLKARTDWLAQYVRDEKDLALQDKLKRTLSVTWDQLDAALKTLQSLTVSVPQAVAPEVKEKKRWEAYASSLKELIGTLTAASEAYVTFRGALLDGSAGQAPLNRMLRAESLRDLMFDEKMQPRPGSSVVELKVQKLAGTVLSRTPTDDKKTFSGGVVLSFIQYEPNGRIKNSGVHTAYLPSR